MAENKEMQRILYLRGLLYRLHRICKFKKVKSGFCSGSSESGMCKYCEFGSRK